MSVREAAVSGTYVAALPMHGKGGVIRIGDPMPDDFPRWRTFNALLASEAVVVVRPKGDPRRKAKDSLEDDLTLPEV